MRIRRIDICAWIAAVLLAVPSAAWSQTNYLHTSGGQIVDSQGRVVRLTGLNWFGFEGPTYCPLGLFARSMGSMLDQLKSLGYNSLRIPFCTQLFDPGSVPNGIDFTLNPDLKNLTGIQILDKLVAAARQRGLKIVLDRHRMIPNVVTELWYTSLYTQARWISDWQILALHYRGNDTVIGCDLHNEPNGVATWGSGDLSTDWRLAAERAGNAILAMNPNLLIFVEGINFGANLTQVGTNPAFQPYNPVLLTVANQLIYSPHDYPQSVAGNLPRYSDPTYPANLPGVWDINWGYLEEAGIAPTWLGEWGTKDLTTSDQQWFRTLTSYLLAHGMSFAYWAWNPDATDTGGLLTDDYNTIYADKQQVLRPLLAPLIPSPSVATFSGYGVVNLQTPNEQDVILSGTQPITSLAITIRIAKTSGVSSRGFYTNLQTPTGSGFATSPGPVFTSSVVDTGTTLVYTYTMVAGQVLPATSLRAGAQYNSAGAHPITSDTFQVALVVGGQAQSGNGTFQP